MEKKSVGVNVARLCLANSVAGPGLGDHARPSFLETKRSDLGKLDEVYA